MNYLLYDQCLHIGLFLKRSLNGLSVLFPFMSFSKTFYSVFEEDLGSVLLAHPFFLVAFPSFFWQCASTCGLPHLLTYCRIVNYLWVLWCSSHVRLHHFKDYSHDLTYDFYYLLLSLCSIFFSITSTLPFALLKLFLLIRAQEQKFSWPAEPFQCPKAQFWRTPFLQLQWLHITRISFCSSRLFCSILLQGFPFSLFFNFFFFSFLRNPSGFWLKSYSSFLLLRLKLHLQVVNKLLMDTYCLNPFFKSQASDTFFGWNLQLPVHPSFPSLQPTLIIFLR